MALKDRRHPMGTLNLPTADATAAVLSAFAEVALQVTDFKESTPGNAVKMEGARACKQT